MPNKAPPALLMVLFLFAMAPSLSIIGRELYDQHDVSNVSIAVSVSPLTAPFFIAHQQGFFRDCGLNVELIPYVGGLRAFEAMANGETDFATSSDSVVTFAATQRNDFRVIASFASSDNDVKILANQGKSFDNGQIKTIGYYPGTASEYLLRTYLAVHSIDPSSVKLVGLDALALVESYAALQLDAIVIWEPYLWQASQFLDGPSAVVDSRNLHSLHFDLVTSSTLLNERESDVLRLVSALQKAIVYIAEHPQESREIVARDLGETSQLINSIWGDYQYKINFSEAQIFSYLANGRWLDLTDNSTQINPRAFVYRPVEIPPIAIAYRQICGVL